MADAPALRAVLLDGPASLQPPKVAAALAAHRHIPLHDAARLARPLWGLVADALPETDAEGLARALEAQGVGALVVPCGRLQDLPDARPVVRTELEALHLQLFSKAREVSALPWDRLTLIAAAGYVKGGERTSKGPGGPEFGQVALRLATTIATGMPFSLRKRTQEVRKVETPAELAFVVDLHERPPARRYRIDGNAFDYGCLGSAMRQGAFPNFRVLLEELRRRAPSAALNAGADLDRESRWRLTLAALGETA
jgi:hypothetical protein